MSRAAVLAADAVPLATLNAPASAQIAGSFSFSVFFDNASTNLTGYGPYVDIAYDQTGQDGAWYPPAAFPPPGAATNEFDGLTLAASVTYLGSALPAADIHLLYFDDTANGGLGVEHPYAIDTNGLPVYVLTSDFSPTNRFQNGDGFLVVRLPFGSFTPEQPVAELFFSGDVSELADVDDSLPISVRGGYMFGNDPLDNPTADPAILGAQDDSDPAVQPTLIEMTKTYIGPENETATGPNFKRRYVLSVDIAEGQVITNLNVIDSLPDTMQFTRVTDTNRAAGEGTISAMLTPSTNTPGGTLQYSFGTVTGTVSAADATLEFEFFVPRLDASSNAVLIATTGDDRLLPNQAHAYGDWIPIDGRDTSARVAALATVAGMVVTPSVAPEHELEAQSIAIQKGVSVIGGGSALPAKVLEYTIEFQVSDYFAFTNVVITDIISDGQRFATNFTPTLSFTEHGNTLSGNMDAANFTVTPNYSEPPAATHLANAPTNGTTTIDFRVSSELVTRGTNDNLVGGGIDSDITGLSGSPYNNPPLPHAGTVGTLVFRTVVQDRYSDDFLSGNPSLNPRDGLSNAVDIDGDLLDPDDLSSLGTTEDDDSGASLGLPAPTLLKSIFAINGSTNLPSPLSMRPGETVTFRLQTTLFTGDIEEFTLSDFVPLPILKVNDPTDIGTNTWSWVRDLGVSDAPPSGEWKYGSTDTFSLGSDLTPPFSDPSVTFNAASGNNTLIFDFGTYDDTSNTTRKVDMLFTMTVNSEPFADNLLLMNQAQASDRNTTTTVADNEVITPFTLNQPMVDIFKGVLASTQGGALTLGGVTYGAPLTAATLAAAETLETQVEVDALGASDLTTNPLPDANDRVRYGVVLFNSGRADAYDVKVTETLPEAYERDFADTNAFVAGVNFIVQRGTGAVLTNGSDYVLGWDNTSKAFSLELVDNHVGGPGLGSLKNGLDNNGALVTGGSNIVVVSYDLLLPTNHPVESTIINTASVTNYAGSESGPNHIPGGRSDDAEVRTPPPSFVKTVTGTEITGTGNGAFDAAISELVTYSLAVTVPEGLTTNAVIEDTLAEGLAFVQLVSTTPSTNVTVANNPATVTILDPGTAQNVRFTLGDIQNSSTTNSGADTVTLVFTAVVLNQNTLPASPGNQAGVTLGNTATFTYSTNGTLASTPAQLITIVEPTLTLTKQIAPDAGGVPGTFANTLASQDAGNTNFYRIVITHSGGPDAFDLGLMDVFNAKLASPTFYSATSSGASTNGSPAVLTTNDFQVSGQTLSFNPASNVDLAPGGSITVVVSVTLGLDLNPAEVIGNTGTVTWTSMDGDFSAARTANNASSDERDGGGGVGTDAAVLNNYAAQNGVGTGQVTAALPLLSKFVVASSETNTLEPLIIADFTATGFDGWTLGSDFTGGNNTWDDSGNTTNLPQFLRIGNTATERGGGYFTYTGPNYLDLRGYNTIGALIRANTGNAATPLWIQLTDADGTVFRLALAASPTAGLQGFSQSVSASLLAPTTIPTAGTTPGLDLARITQLELRGDNGTSAMRMDIDRIVALRTLAVPGEIVRYRLVAQIPEGTSPDFAITDAIPPGLRFINDGSVRVAFVANGGGIASSAAGIGPAAVTNLTGTGLNLTGSGDDVSSFSLAVSGTNGLAIGEGSGFDTNNVSNARNSENDAYNDGTDVWFRLGTLVNSDTDADAEYVVLEFNALLSNDRDVNAANGSAQQAGANLSNTFQTRINSSTGNAQVGLTSTGNDFQAVVIVEPQINNLAKSLLTAPADAGDAVSYEIRFANDTAHPAQYAPRVRVATTAAFTATFNALGGAGGTGSYSNAPTVIDGVTLAIDDRVLVKNQATASQNGIYRVVDAATGIWDRAVDFDTALEMTLGYRAYVTAGTVNGGRTYALDAAVATINVTALAFSEVPGNPAVRAATTANLGGFAAGVFTAVSATQDGITLSVGDRVLVRAQGTRSQNGVYVVTSAGGGTMNMSRAADFNAATEFPIGIQVYVTQGDRMAGRTFAQTANVATINTSNIDWALVEQVAAFDLALTDVLPTNVLFQSVTVVSPDGTTNRTTSGAIPGGTVTVPTVGATGTVTVAIDALAPTAWLTGPVSNVTVTINGTIETSTDARTEILNTARLTYTSLPGTKGTAVNPTGTDPTTSGSVSATGGQYGERNGSGVTATDNTRVNYDILNINNYSVGATLVHALARPAVDKAFQDGSITADDTSVGSSSGADVVIGEDVAFDILVTLPEGSTRALRVDEILPAGLRLDSWLVLTNAVDADQLTADFNGTLAVPTVAPVLPVTGAQAVTYDFSNTVVAADNNTSNNAFVIRLQTTVLNVAGNQEGVTRTNATLLRYDGAQTGETVPDGVPGNNPVVTVREPVLVIDKSVVPTVASASNTVTYTIVITNTSAQTAYDLSLYDPLPAKLNAPSLTVNPGSDFEITVFGGTNVVRVKPASTVNIATGGSLTIEVEGILDILVEAGETIVNTAFIEWTSTPGANADERDGSDGSGGPLDDYATSDPASLLIGNATIDKQWRDGTISADDTSLPSSTGTNVVIGETMTYDILVTLTEGQTSDLVIRDHVPAGLRLDSFQFFTNAVDSTLLSANYLGTITNAPSVSLPAAGPATVDFVFGDTITSPDNNSTNDSFVLRVTATVTNIVGNQDGTTVTNTADVQYDIPGLGVTTYTDFNPTNDPVSTVREPVLTIAKTVSPLLADSTNTVTYTLVITNTSDQVAYDLTLADWLPLLVESPTLTVNPGADFEIANVGGTNLLRVILANTVDVGVGASLTLEVQGTVSTNALPGTTFTNAALIGWSSLPGASGEERDDSDGPGGVLDDYAATDDAVFTVYTHSISGYVYEDDDNDGVRDPSESEVSGVTVTLTGTDHLGNPVTLATTTDVNGFYSFTGLRPGTYTVTKTQPDGYIDGKETSGSPWAGTVNNATISHTIATIVIPIGTPSTVGTEYNFGLRGPGSIGDRVWLDENSDGIQDAGEDGIANVTVRLYDDTGTNLLAETVTDTEGNYLFPGLIAGDYGVQVVISSMAASLAANPTYDLDGTNTAHVADVTLAAGENRVDADFGYNWSATTNVINGTGTGAIGDRIWIDTNGNGVQDPGEAGLAGIEVRIYYDANTNGMYTNLFTAAVDQNGNTGTGITTNGADGRYVFDALPAGAYVIEVNGGVTPGTYTQTGDPDFFGQNLPGGEDDNQTTMPIILAPGDVFVNADFGYQPASDTALSGTVYFDSDANESLDGPDYGIRSVTVALLDTNGVVIATTRTATNGFYRFTGLQAGEYTVWVNDTGNLLGELTQTEDPDLARDGRNTVTLDGIADVTGIDFGYTPAEHAAGDGLIGDRIWLDLNGDGVQDVGESGLGGVTVRLYDASTNLLETVVTDANGNYAFGGLATNSVTYIVRVDTNSLPNGGTGLANTGDPNGGADSESSVTLTGASPIDLAQDFGYNQAVLPNTIGGTLWEDRDADGTLEGGETNRFEGVTVLLADTNGNVIATTVTDANGDYLFTGLPDGTYRVDVTDTANVLNGYWHSDGPNDGSNNNSQVDPYTVSVSGGATNTTGDFGYYVDAAALGNRVWLDANVNGIQNTGEVGMTNVLLRLTIAYDNGITNVVSTLSNTNGFYSFGNLLLDEHQNGTNTASPVFTISAINPGTNFNHTVFNHSGTPAANDSDRPTGVIATTIQGVTGVSLNGEDPYAPSNEVSQAWYDFGFSLTPTLAVITGVRSRIEDGVAVISWDVSLEIGTVGYALDRWVDGAWLRISEDWIMADLITAGTKTYEQRDPDAPVGSVQRYQIVELDTLSRQLYYGPYDLALDGGEISYATWVAGIVWGSTDSAPNADPDRDRLTNFQEYLAGTDPLNANSVLRVSSLDRIPEGIRLRWPSVDGRFYAIEMAPSLGVAFQAVATDIQDTAPENVYVVPVALEDGQQGFYRVIVK